MKKSTSGLDLKEETILKKEKKRLKRLFQSKSFQEARGKVNSANKTTDQQLVFTFARGAKFGGYGDQLLVS